MEMKKAERKNMPALVAIWGPSNSGKTYSGLLVARGLAGPNGIVVVIDTENRRAEYYDNMIGGWFHIDLQPPFTTQRYIEAYEMAIKGRAACVMFDTISHVWAGEGGIVDQGTRSNGLAAWKAPKIDYRKMTDRLLRSNTHAVFLLRAKEGVRQVGKEVTNTGAQPVCGKDFSFIYDMTVAVLLGPDKTPQFQDGSQSINCNALIPGVKVPEPLSHIIRKGERLSIQTGEQIAAWVKGGTALDFDQVALERAAREAAGKGTAKFLAHWKSLSKIQQVALAPLKDSELKKIAADADFAAAEDDPAGDNSVLDDMPTEHPALADMRKHADAQALVKWFNGLDPETADAIWAPYEAKRDELAGVAA